jgi:hypothetical protein
VTTKNSIARLRTAALSIALLAASTAPAWAYLDPGTGSMMLQLMLGGIAGVAVVGKLYLRRATDFIRQFGRRRRNG